jgi:hypothetical protein
MFWADSEIWTYAILDNDLCSEDYNSWKNYRWQNYLQNKAKRTLAIPQESFFFAFTKCFSHKIKYWMICPECYGTLKACWQEQYANIEITFFIIFFACNIEPHVPIVTGEPTWLGILIAHRLSKTPIFTRAKCFGMDIMMSKLEPKQVKKVQDANKERCKCNNLWKNKESPRIE